MAPAPSPEDSSPSARAGDSDGKGFGSSCSADNFVSTPANKNLSHDLLLSALPSSVIDGHPCPTLGGIPLERRLGQGGMGVVYYGQHPRLKVSVAVKVLTASLLQVRPESVDRFFREAQLAARAKSPHLVGVFDVNEDSGFYYLVMEYVDGCSAEQYLHERRQPEQAGIDEREALVICHSAALGLADAHRAGVIHRDIKPSNVLIPRSQDGRTCELRAAKLTDLGLACSVQADHSLTAEGLALGTPGFMAPEQCLDSTRVGQPADVFSLTATLYALLSGKPPFDASTSMATLLATVNESLVMAPELRRVGPVTRRLLELGLSREPEDRFANGEALAQALTVCLEAHGRGPSAQTDAVATVEALAKGRPASSIIAPAASKAGRWLSGGLIAIASMAALVVLWVWATRAPVSPVDPALNPAPPQPGPPIGQAADPDTNVARPPGPGNAVENAERAYQDAMRAAHNMAGGQEPLWRLPPDKREAVREWLQRALRARPDGPEAQAMVTGLTPPPQWSLELGGEVRISFLLMPPGSFSMGREGEAEDEGPEHRVRFDKVRYIAKIPVTVAQFDRFVLDTGYSTDAEREGKGFVLRKGVWTHETGRNWRSPGFKQGPCHPAVLVSWDDAQAFARWLATRSGLTVRLPTEAEWEYAARGPEGRLLPWGNAWSGDKANHADLALTATEAAGPRLRLSRDNDGFAFTAPAGFCANASWCGALDMSGNVWQWCRDWYAPDTYARSAAIEPLGPDEGRSRVTRGGSWADPPSSCQSCVRHSGKPNHAYACVGFRLVLEP